MRVQVMGSDSAYLQLAYDVSLVSVEPGPGIRRDRRVYIYAHTLV